MVHSLLDSFGELNHMVRSLGIDQSQDSKMFPYPNWIPKILSEK